MDNLKAFNLAVAFLLELCMLAAFAYWGFHLDTNVFFRIIAGIGGPLVVTILWGVWLAPNADLRLGVAWLVVLKIALFGLASLSLFVSNQPGLGIILLSVFAVSEGLGLMWDQERA